jgi:hypothetical protein
VNITFKLKETPLNYMAIKLLRESSLIKRVELLDNKYLKRHAFKRVSLILEELPPLMNFLKKLIL